MTFRHSLNIAFAALILPLISLTGCFTGVESTPRITAADVKRVQPVAMPEDNYLADLGGESFASWKEGKRFYVTDNKIGLIFGPTTPAGETLSGNWIEYAGSRPATGVTGATETDLQFRSQGGALMVYRVSHSPDTLMARRSVEIPFTVEESLVDSVRDRLVGKRFYTVTRYWRDDDDNPVLGRKFVAVIVDSVTPGNSVYPLKISFHDDEGRSARLFMSPGPAGSTPRTFASLFALTDPHLRYPSISPENWALIIDGKVALDMTRDECRLSLGVPKDVDRRAGYNSLQEVWSYENGIYLLFEDGLLRRFRK